MKLLFLQLSDMHCKKNERGLTTKIDKVVTAVKTLAPVDHVVLVFSGDLVDKNTEDEYSVGRSMLGRLLPKLADALGCGWIETQIVPGNHDMDLPDGCRDAATIETWDKQEHLNEELDRIQRFFNFSKKKKCFREDMLCDVSILQFGNLKVQVCKLNSAPFSTRKPDDKQFHYFPSYVGEKLNRHTDVDIKITIMHHHYEWCEWDTKEMLKKAIATDDITFFGHDHKAEILTTKYTDGRTNNVFMGGRFNLDLSKEATFNAVIYDDETKTLERHEFIWSTEDGLFIPKNCGEIAVRSNSLIPQELYLNKLLADTQGIGKSLLDYYTLPKLTAEGGAFTVEEKAEEITVEDIFAAVTAEQAVRITGRSGAGKTALLKFLYAQSINAGFVPLLVENRDYRDSKIEKMFSDLFEEQYGQPTEHAYIAYQQTEAKQKIVFIDNIDLIKNPTARKNLVDTILESGRLLIYTTKERNQDLEEIVRNKLEGKAISTIDICPMYKETRDSLIEKTGQILEKKRDDIVAVKLALDYMVQCQTTIFTFTPGNTLQYIKYFFQEGVKDKKGTQTISLVFETNIRNAVLAACKKDATASVYLLALEFLADYMYFTLQAERVGLEQLSQIIGLFNTKRKANVNPKQFLEICDEANILKPANDTFAVGFYDKNIYAYFVARELNRQLEKSTDNLPKLKYVMEHICFGINDTIILFLSFIRSNTQILINIADETEKLLQDYLEWNFEQQNIPFLHNTSGMPEGIPTQKDRKDANKHAELVEKERHNSIKFRGIFDYDENDVNKKRYIILRALRYTQLISRAFVDQYGALEAEEIDRLVDVIYSAPQKIIYATLKPYQDHSEDIVKNLCKFVEEKIPEETFSEEKIRELFGQAGTVLALNIMNDIAFNAANENTIPALREGRTNNLNSKVFCLMMEENVGDTSEFVRRAVILRKEIETSPYAKMLLGQIARKHIIYTGNIDHREVNKLLSGGVLATETKPLLLLEKGTGNKE